MILTKKKMLEGREVWFTREQFPREGLDVLYVKPVGEPECTAVRKLLILSYSPSGRVAQVRGDDKDFYVDTVSFSKFWELIDHA